MNTTFERSSNSTDEWYTPKEIIDALGKFDLDPCAPVNPLWETATQMYNYKEMSRIKFQRQQGNIKGKSSLELLNEFFMFLQGECPDAISVREMPKLNSQQAFSVIYYLQEHLPVFPDTIEKCDRCGELFDLFYSGTHCDVCGNLCESCDDCLCNKED